MKQICVFIYASIEYVQVILKNRLKSPPGGYKTATYSELRRNCLVNYRCTNQVGADTFIPAITLVRKPDRPFVHSGF